MRSGPETATVEWQFKKSGVPEIVTSGDVGSHAAHVCAAHPLSEMPVAT